MKKGKAALAVGLCLAVGLGGASLVACTGGGETNEPAGPSGDPFASETAWTTPETTHWLAGNFKGLGEQWNDNDGKAPDEKLRFEQSTESGASGYYRLVVDLYAGDQFKIRYEGMDWGSGTNKGAYPYECMSQELKDATDPGIGPSGEGLGGGNFKVMNDGKYEIRLVESADGSSAEVTYVRKGDAASLEIPATAIKLDKKEIVLDLSEETQAIKDEGNLVATLTPADATDKITWSTSDDKVATVSNGTVKAVAVGECTITVKVGSGETEIKDECVVTVVQKAVPVTDVELKDKDNAAIDVAKTVSLHAGQTYEVNAKIAPADANLQTVAYAVGEGESATVAVDKNDANKGVITAVKPGESKITVTAEGITKTINVVVEKDFYLVGESSAAYFPGWNVIGDYSKVNEKILLTPVAPAEQGEKIIASLETTLPKDTKFKVLTVGNGWDGGLGYANLAAATENDDFNKETEVAADGENIKILAAAKYKIDVIETTSGKATTYTLKITKVGEAEVVAWSYDILFHGGWDGATAWSGIKVPAENAFDKDHTTWTGDVALKVGAFGVQTVHHGTANQVGWFNSGVMELANGVDGITLPEQAGNANCTKAGTYNVTITLDADGNITKILFNSYTAPAAE